MYSTFSLRTVALAAIALLAAVTAAFSQTPTYEEQAREILRLYEAGQKDSAYMLIEPLKKSARFVPAVLYTRAQLTPDDRALNLYREAVALDPTGIWADDCIYQLVRRYTDKGDSVAALTWMNLLKSSHASSPFIPDAEKVLAGTTVWHNEEAEPVPTPKKEVKETKPAKPPVATKVREPKPAKPAKSTEADNDADDAPTTTTYRSTAMRGYALQVGLFPTKELADKRVAELKKKKISASALPKMVDGKKQYALVVGPYTTMDDASKKKTTVTTACDCKAFIVKVE
jgi:cell division septation protein DedD